MAAVLTPRQGILLNSSPSGSPFRHSISLPGTPHLIPSYSSLSSTASSSNGGSDVDTYLLTVTSSRPSTSHNKASLPATATPRPSTSDGTKARTGSPPSAPRRIRFAPLPDPRREVLLTEDGNEIPYPTEFTDGADENVITVQDFSPRASFDKSGSLSTGGKALMPNSSLLLASTQHGVSLIHPHDVSPPNSTHSAASNSDSTPTPSTNAMGLVSSPACGANDSIGPHHAPSGTLSSEHSCPPDLSSPLSPKYSPHTLASPAADLCELDSESLKGSVKRSSGSGRWKSKLLKPLLGPLHRGNSPSNNAPGGVDHLLKHSNGRGRESVEYDDRASVFSDKKRAESLREFGSGVAFDRTSTITSTLTTNSLPPTLMTAPALRPRKKNTSHSLFSSPTATSLNLFSSSKATKKAELARSQSLGGRGPGGVRRGQLRMLNGRVYGARRVDPFANIRDQEPEFIEWGFGGMGSVSSGGSSMWSKVQSGAGVSVGACDEQWGGSTGSGTSSGGSGRGADDFDDGSGMAWVRRRREKREQERREREEQEEMERLKGEKELAETETTEQVDVEESMTEDAGETTSPVALTASPVDVDAADTDGLAKAVKDVKEGEEHITEAVTVPAPSHHHPHHSHSSSHHRPSNSFDRASTIKNVPERRGSADTARGVPSPVGVNKEADVSLPVAHEKSSSTDSGSADGETDEIVTSPDASANATEDELSSDSDSEEDEQEQRRRTALSAGVEKISRHKLTPSQSYAHTPDGSNPVPAA